MFMVEGRKEITNSGELWAKGSRKKVFFNGLARGKGPAIKEKKTFFLKKQTNFKL